MGFNQTVMMAFAMQIVTPLIGGKGLGLEVFNGLARSDTVSYTHLTLPTNREV